MRPSVIQKILVTDRFAPLRAHLETLLAGLTAEEWTRPTAAPGWSVKDVASHLLGGDLAILSRVRDEAGSGGPELTHGQLIDLINRLNAEWVTATRRLSPRVLCDLLSFAGPEVEGYFSSLDPDAMGGPVSWAGPEPAPVWFDLAREFTERWHHQQQIRDAAGREPLYDPYFLQPVLAAFVRVLPYTFRHVSAPSGTALRFEIAGDAGGVWFLLRGAHGWELGADAEPSADVIVSQDAAWRLFTKDRQKARETAVVRGDAALASHIFGATSIIG